MNAFIGRLMWFGLFFFVCCKIKSNQEKKKEKLISYLLQIDKKENVSLFVWHEEKKKEKKETTFTVDP